MILALWGMSALVAVALAAYLWGRRVGRGEGLALGDARASLELRERLLREDRCPLCGQSCNLAGRAGAYDIIAP